MLPILVNKIMASGCGPGLAAAFTVDTADSLTATGTNQATAYETSTALARFTTVASGTGVLLDNGSRGDSQFIVNDGANTLLVYPHVGGSINNLGTNAAFSIAAGSWAMFGRYTDAKWVGGNDAATISFMQSGTGAVASTVQAKFRSAFADAKTDFGAVGDGVTDDTTALQNWLNVGRVRPLYLPAGTYLHTSKLTTTGGSTIYGAGQNQSIIKKGFNGDQFDWADLVAFVDIVWDGNGGTYTGSNATISSGTRQSMLRCIFKEAASNPIKWTVADIGTEFSFIDSVIKSHTLTIAGLLFNSGDTATFTKGTLVGIDCEGGVLFDTSTGAVGTIRAIGCTCTGITTNANDVAQSFVGCRFATNDVHIKGTNTVLLGCTLAGDLYLDAGANNCAIGPNTYAAGKKLTDNSAVTNNVIYDNLTGLYNGVMTGVTATANVNITWTKTGNTVVVNIGNLNGYTSNSTAKTITGMPAVIRPANTYTAKRGVCIIQDNGTLAYGQWSLASSGVITVYPNAALGNWTAAGTCGILDFTIVYDLS